MKVLFCEGLIVMVDGLTWAFDVDLCTIEE